jgi:hypothetical protein
MSSTFLSELERLSKTLGAGSDTTDELSLPALAKKLAKHLNVKVDEVAILGVSHRWKHLHFIIPVALKNVGFIPLTSNSALAARTVRENKPEINNTFAAARHASVFEGVKAVTTTGESIQKIVSAPIVFEGNVVGVMQISRKGNTPIEAGPDFTAEDLKKVLSLTRPIGNLVKLWAGE